MILYSTKFCRANTFLFKCLCSTTSIMTAYQLACRVPGTLVRNTCVYKGYVTSIYKEESILHYSFTTTKIQKSSDKSLRLHNSCATQIYNSYLLTDRRMHQQISIQLRKFSKINRCQDRKVIQQHSSESLSRETS